MGIFSVADVISKHPELPSAAFRSRVLSSTWLGSKTKSRQIRHDSRSASMSGVGKMVRADRMYADICADTWYAPDWPGDKGAEQVYTLSDALAVAVWLNVFIRQARNVGMANIAQSVNVLSPILTTKEGLVKQTIFYPLYLFSKYMRGHSLAVHVRSPEYKESMEKALSADGTNFAWLNSTCDLPLLDVSASKGPAVDGEEPGKYVSLAVVNASDTDKFAPAFDIAGGARRTNVFTLSGSDPKAMNTSEEIEVSIKERVHDDISSYVLPKSSFTLFRWKEES